MLAVPEMSSVPSAASVARENPGLTGPCTRGYRYALTCRGFSTAEPGWRAASQIHLQSMRRLLPADCSRSRIGLVRRSVQPAGATDDELAIAFFVTDAFVDGVEVVPHPQQLRKAAFRLEAADLAVREFRCRGDAAVLALVRLDDREQQVIVAGITHDARATAANRAVCEPELDCRTAQPREPDIHRQRFRCNGRAGIEADSSQHIVRGKRHRVRVSNPNSQDSRPGRV